MADVEARREARRRKILQNSENRLKLITGEHNGPINAINSKENVDERNLTQSKYDENDVELENHVGNHITCDRTYFPEQNLIDAPNVENSTSKTFYISSKIYISFLAVFIRLLYIFNLQCYIQNSVLVPFIIVKVSMLFLQSGHVSNNTLLSTLLIFSSIPPSQSKLITALLAHFLDIVSDFCLYYFMFVICHICVQCIV